MTLGDLRVPPGDRLERLEGDRAGQYSIRIDDQWRVCFRWKAGDAYDVEIVHAKRAVTADTALRLGRYFGTTPRFWLDLQAQYDPDTEQDRLGDRLDTEVTTRAS